MPYADAKVPSALYKYGPVKYVIKGGIRLSDDWILEHTVPNIVKVCAMEVDLILALPLMWSDFHGNKSQFVPRDIVERILSVYTGYRHVCNIKKITIFIEGNEDNFNMIEVEESKFNGGEVTNIARNEILHAQERNGWYKIQRFLKHSAV